MIQEVLVRIFVGFLMVYWMQRLSRSFWVKPVTSWLLRRGHVKWAMKIRFPKR